MFVTCLNCSERYAAEQFRETKRLWSRISGLDKTGGRGCYHGFQSFGDEGMTAERAHEIGVELARRLWGDRFEVVVATHCDTDHYHNHYAINSVSFKDGMKFRDTFRDFYSLREENDRLCLENGLSIVETPAVKGRNRGEYKAEKRGEPTFRSLIRADIDRAVSASVTEREFFGRLRDAGYDLLLVGEDGRPVKYPALRPPGADHFVRFHKLGSSEYTLEGIRERVAGNYKRSDPLPDDKKREIERYREEAKPDMKIGGLYALYMRYSHELYFIGKYPASVKRMSDFMREDLIHMKRLDEQTKLLGRNRISTICELEEFRTRSEMELERLDGLRRDLRNDLKRAVRASDMDRISGTKSRISGMTEKMKRIRNDLKLCGMIEERSAVMAEEIEMLTERRIADAREEEERDEQLFGRCGGTGRANEPGRN